MTKLALVLLLVSGFAPLLPAGSFKTNVTGHIRSQRSVGLDMAIASAEADPLWGHADEAAFEAYKKQAGPLPKVTVKGSGYTNSKGRFLFEATVSWDDSGTMPTKTYRSKEGKDIEYVSVAVIFKATAKGYANGTQKGVVNDGFEATVDFAMAEASVVKGGVVLAEGRKFLPELKLLLLRRTYSGNKVIEDVRHEFSTDKDGFFEVTGDDKLTGVLMLRVAGSDYAFEHGSPAWRGVTMRGGTQDLGILAVVPGGRLKFKVVDSVTGGNVNPGYGTLQGTDQSKYFQIGMITGSSGRVDEEGVPAGTYNFTFRIDGHWAPEVAPIEIKAGGTVDLGDLKCGPVLEIEVIAFGSDGGLARFSASLVYLGDNAPPAARSFRDTDPIRVAGNLTAENCRLKGLFAGDWQITVQAEAYADYTTTITVPLKEPLKVTLEQGGAIEYEIEDGSGRKLHSYWVFALRHDTPGHEQLADKGGDVLEQYMGHSGKVLPEGAYFTRDYNKKKLEKLPAGTYLLISDLRSMVVSADNIVVKAGESVKATLIPRPGKLTIKVTEGGKAKADYSFYLRFEADRQPQLKLTTDKSGVVVHESTLTASPWVLTQAENDWVSAPRENNHWSVLNEQVFPGRQATMQVAKDNEFNFEISAKEQVFVRIALTLQEGQSVKTLHLSPAKGNKVHSFRALMCAKVGEEFCFPCVPQGAFNVGGMVESKGSGGYFTSEIVVNKTGEQAFSVAVALYQLDVTIKVAEGMSINDVRVYLQRVQTENVWPRNEPDMLLPDEDGTISFDCLSPGDYYLFVRVYDEGNVLVNALRKSVTVKENTTLSVPVTDKVGTISVQIEGDPLRSTRGTIATPMVYFVDAKGKTVQPGDPSLLDEIWNYNFSVPGIPVGTYTVVVAAPGFQPYEIKEVKIEKGKTTSVKATPEKAGALVVNLSSLYFDLATEIAWAYEDDKGKPVKVWLPGGNVTSATMGDNRGNGGVMEFINLTPAVKQVRIKVEGYKDVVVKVDVKTGELITKDAKGEKK